MGYSLSGKAQRSLAALVSFGFIVASGAVRAEATPEEINGYFNPRPDPFVDLDLILDLTYASEAVAGSETGNAELDYDRRVEDADASSYTRANLAVALRKSIDADIAVGASFTDKRYKNPGSGFVDRYGQLLSFVDSGTADPRSFWFSTLAFGASDSEFEDASEFQIELGFGRGRVYSTRAFYEANVLIERLRASGKLSGDPSTEQLYAVSRIIDEEIRNARLATDESHGLGFLRVLRQWSYNRTLHRDLWAYLVDQGLVSESSNDIDAAFDIRYALESRALYSWEGGAETSVGILFNTGNEIDDNAFVGGGAGFESVFEQFDLTDTTLSTFDDTLAVYFDYEQHWPQSLDVGYSVNSRVLISTDSVLAGLFDMDYRRQLSEYTFLNAGFDVLVSTDGDDTATALALNSGLIYELGPSSSLDTDAYVRVNSETDTTYGLNVELVFDLM